jgi:hypothetical protein
VSRQADRGAVRHARSDDGKSVVSLSGLQIVCGFTRRTPTLSLPHRGREVFGFTDSPVFAFFVSTKNIGLPIVADLGAAGLRVVGSSRPRFTPSEGRQGTWV